MPCANNCKQKGCETCGSICKRCACACDGIDPALAVNRKRGGQRKSPFRGGRVKRRSSVAATTLINAQVTDEAKPTTYGSTNGPFPAAESPKDLFDTLKIDSSWYIRARLPTSAEVVTPDLFALIVTAAVACCILVCKLLASACKVCPEKVIQGMARKVINENEEKERERLENAVFNGTVLNCLMYRASTQMYLINTTISYHILYHNKGLSIMLLLYCIRMKRHCLFLL